ncbi:MAG TPA: phosphotransacetylase family protein [Candidatus Bathyarchaeota archaeon]|nr:phosphotransacetylase family protein [Candidatus Bathyarchaeota archaeon]
MRANCIIKPYLEKHHIRVLGVIPEDRVLSSLTVREIYESVGGKVLAGEDGMDKIVQTFLVGAMTMESAIKYFRKASNKIVITGGDRTDLILAALETRSSAVILTGNLYPSVKILPRADELAIPIILVPYDTFTTLQLAQKIIGKIKPRDKKRIEIAKRLIEENVKWDDILN